MISVPEVATDDAHYPIVSWTETRSVLAPGGPGVVRVECRITKDAKGQLLFTRRGAVGHGSFEDGKPLARLTGFSRQAAEPLYYAPRDIELKKLLMGKSRAGQVLLGNHAQVVLAEFGGDEPLHLTYADASAVEFERLEVALAKAFGDHKRLSAGLSETLYQWPIADGRVVTYDPLRAGGPNEQPLPFLLNLITWVIPIGTIAALMAFFLWVMGFLKLPF